MIRLYQWVGGIVRGRPGGLERLLSQVQVQIIHCTDSAGGERLDLDRIVVWQWAQPA